MIKNAVIFLLVLVSTVGFSQEVNQTDAKGKKQGVWKKYHSNGVISEEGEYSTSKNYRGKKNGIWKYYSAIGMLEYEEEYKNGEVVNYKPAK